jgi:hypothetical protein
MSGKCDVSIGGDVTLLLLVMSVSRRPYRSGSALRRDQCLCPSVAVPRN